MSEQRPATPAHVELALRQEAAFGCCKCGLPIYQYHHIVEYSKDEHFRVEDMMVLCPNHHHEATVKAMLVDEQRAWKANPHNVRKGYVGGLLKVNQTYCAVKVGTCELVSDGAKIKIDGDSLLSLGITDDGRLTISLALYDKVGNLLCFIENNEWISGDSIPWDIESAYQRIRIREKARNISLEVDARKSPMILRANIWRNGHNISIDDRGIHINSTLSKFDISNLALVGMLIDIDSLKGEVLWRPADGYLNGALVSSPKPRERLWIATGRLRSLR